MKDIHILKVNSLTPEKKQELKELMGKYSGKVSLSEMVMSDYDNSDFDIEDLFEYDVSDPLWLRVCNSQIPYTELINKNALLLYLQERNQKYCDEQCLCEVCRSPLVEIEESRGEHFGTNCGEVMWHCPNGCE